MKILVAIAVGFAVDIVADVVAVDIVAVDIVA